jgi:hypothetical protein
VLLFCPLDRNDAVVKAIHKKTKTVYFLALKLIMVCWSFSLVVYGMAKLACTARAISDR